MADQRDGPKVWHRETDRALAGESLLALSETFERAQTRRKREATQLHQLYAGERIGGGANFLDRDEDLETVAAPGSPIDITLNVAQDIVDTIVSKLAATESNKPQFVVTDGSWEVRRRAILADRLVEGVFRERQGKFFDLWDVFQHALRIALAPTGTAAVKFFSDPREGRVCAELHDTLSMWTDTGGQPYEFPTSMGELTWWDADRLIAKYPAFRAQILDAIEPVQGGTGQGLETLDRDYDYVYENVERVKVCEGWRFKYLDKPGRYCMAIKGATLEFKDYDHEDPPFVFVGGIRSLTGFWHRSALQSIAAPILRVNDILRSLDDAESLTPRAVYYFDPEVTPKEHVESIDDVIAIPVVGMNRGIQPGKYEHPPPFHPLVLEFLKWYLELCYSLSGVNQFHTSGSLKGDWSGVALRLLKQQLNERFAPIQRAYVQASCVEAAKQIIRCVKELGKDFKTSWKGDEGFLREIDSRVLAVLDEHKWTVDVYAVAESKNTPESRVSLAEELMQTGIITGDAFVEILRHYDTVGESETTGSQKRFIAKQIDRWLFAEPDEIADGGFYRGPVRTMDLFAAVAQVNKAYIDAQTDEVEPARLKLFERFLQQCEKYIREKQSMQMQMAQQGGGTAAAVAAAGQPGGTPRGPAAAAA